MNIEDIDFKSLALLSPEQAHRYRAIPAGIQNGIVWCFMMAEQWGDVAELEFVLGRPVHVVEVGGEVFERHLARYYPVQTQAMTRTKTDLKEDSDIVRFVRKIMEEAAAVNASDIHVERYESHARVRFRWEGQLVEKYEVPLGQYNAVVSRIKILAELDISERRLPQDGRILFESGGHKLDVRVSTLPGKFGEKVVLRLLSRSPSFLKLENLGMRAQELSRFQTSLMAQNGIILITGPTGSGKTTTLYAALSLLNKPNVNISTIEDPIEYNLEGINQVQVKEDIGMTFGLALRAFLRQDPNIIMVGEIRDHETAEIAIRSAMTGRLVFSTLHTNSSWDAVIRLIDMGVEPYLLAATVRVVVAQRLLRQLCDACKQVSQEADVPPVLLQAGLKQHYLPQGCPACQYTGYAPRVAIYEVIPINKELAGKIKRMDLEIDEYLQREGILTLRDQVVELIRKGETSLEEGIMYLMW